MGESVGIGEARDLKPGGSGCEAGAKDARPRRSGSEALRLWLRGPEAPDVKPRGCWLRT